MAPPATPVNPADVAIADAAYAAGFRGAKLGTVAAGDTTGGGISPLIAAVALAFAVSGGNPGFHRVAPGVDERGAWGINILRHPQYAPDNLYNLTTCAAAFYEVVGGGSAFCNYAQFETWCGPNHDGSYRNFVDRATIAVNALAKPGQNAGVPTPGQPNAPGDAGAATPEGIPNPLAGIGAALGPLAWLGKAGAWISNRHNVVRVMLVLGGALVAYEGLKYVAPNAAKTVAAPVHEAGKAAAVAAVA